MLGLEDDEQFQTYMQMQWPLYGLCCSPDGVRSTMLHVNMCVR